jgi:hypothetical protein
MSSQVSDLYKKYNDLVDQFNDLKNVNKDILYQVDKVKLENKDLQSEIILLVKQMASLEKLVHTKYMNSGPGAPKAYEVNYDDAGNPRVMSGKKHANMLKKRQSKDKSHQYYIVNPRTKQIVRNPDYHKPSDNDPVDTQDHDDFGDDDVPF